MDQGTVKTKSLRATSLSDCCTYETCIREHHCCGTVAGKCESLETDTVAVEVFVTDKRNENWVGYAELCPEEDI